MLWQLGMPEGLPFEHPDGDDLPLRGRVALHVILSGKDVEIIFLTLLQRFDQGTC